MRRDPVPARSSLLAAAEFQALPPWKRWSARGREPVGRIWRAAAKRLADALTVVERLATRRFMLFGENHDNLAITGSRPGNRGASYP